MRCLYILEINPLSVTSFANIFSHFVGCLFVLFMVSFAVQKVLNLIRSYLFIFLILGGEYEKILLGLHHWVFCLYFLLGVLWYPALWIMVFNPFWDYFGVVLDTVLTSSFYVELYRFPSTTYWRDCLFSIVYSCLLCHRLVGHKCLG